MRGLEIRLKSVCFIVARSLICLLCRSLMSIAIFEIKSYLGRNEGENAENSDFVQEITTPSSGKTFI